MPHPRTGLNHAKLNSVEMNILFGKSMSFEVQVYPTMPTRPCRFCLSLQGGSVFADFDVDEEGHAFLRRISFDGYGCCHGEFKKLGLDDSRLLIGAVERGALGDPKVEDMLRSYFQDNTDIIWSEALVSHELA